MSYGITGDLEKAKATFEYGLSKDDKYTMFYYNLACTCAEMNDLDSTLRQLKSEHSNIDKICWLAKNFRILGRMTPFSVS